MELKAKAASQFKISARGMVVTKGKGCVTTYWIETTERFAGAGRDNLQKCFVKEKGKCR